MRKNELSVKIVSLTLEQTITLSHYDCMNTRTKNAVAAFFTRTLLSSVPRFFFFCLHVIGPLCSFEFFPIDSNASQSVVKSKNSLYKSNNSVFVSFSFDWINWITRMISIWIFKCVCLRSPSIAARKKSNSAHKPHNVPDTHTSNDSALCSFAHIHHHRILCGVSIK